MDSKPRNRFYVKESVVRFEEDATHEFKGHRNLAVEEVPHWCWIPGTNRRSRKAVSRNINSFLNNGQGGIVYLGIVDDGQVKGIPLSQYQKDHVIVSMRDLMSRYSPQVPDSSYKVEFVPIIQKADMWKTNPKDLEQRGSDEIDPNRLKPHLLRTPHYCWCDKTALEKYAKGTLSPEYVIEITISPHTGKPLTFEDGRFCLNLHPIYEDEEGNCFFRRQASVVKYNRAEVVEFTIHEIQCHFLPVIEKIRKKVEDLMVQGTQKLKEQS